MTRSSPPARLARHPVFSLGILAAALAASATAPVHAQASDIRGDVTSLEEIRVLPSAEEAVKQAPGVSIMTAEDIQKRPPANDLSELIRTMPGVNLTGNSPSGNYGNSRQIDLRGMGPENTLILIDGKPVSSRDAVRMGRNGERNTRGDSNWVPANAIERIEVLRGPAAARYGSGAAGGVVNIITKAPTDEFSGSVTVYGLLPEDSDYGATRRAGFNLSGPIAEKLSFRVYGNVAKTDADKPALNADASGIPVDATNVPPAGREGVRNKDINGLLRLDINRDHRLELEGSFSRQGNIYAGERLFSRSTETIASLADDGAETNIMYRRAGSLSHFGDYGQGRRSRLTMAYEGTTNSRLNEGLAGSVEGAISNPGAGSVSELRSLTFSGEYNTPLQLAGKHVLLTMGFEHREQRLDDEYATTFGQSINNNSDSLSKSRTSAAYLEGNIELTEALSVTPGVRLDHHNKFGANWSPSLNASYLLTDTITLKGGIARAFKAPNLYQSNPNYLYQTRGNGCPVDPYTGLRVSGPCYIFGNADLAPERSVNKEIGIAYDDAGWAAGLTYFQNDYSNKIVADMGDQAIAPPTLIGGSIARPFQWVNSGKAVIRGLEGNLTVPLIGENGETLSLSNNLTYMITNKSKETNQPLTVIPRYTLNSTLDWRVNDKLSLMATATFYGKQKPRSHNLANNTEVTGEGLRERGSYGIYGLSAGYQVSKSTNVRLGVNNLFDKRLYREDSGSAQGANTYNEPGREFYATLTTRF